MFFSPNIHSAGLRTVSISKPRVLGKLTSKEQWIFESNSMIFFLKFPIVLLSVAAPFGLFVSIDPPEEWLCLLLTQKLNKPWLKEDPREEFRGGTVLCHFCGFSFMASYKMALKMRWSEPTTALNKTQLTLGDLSPLLQALLALTVDRSPICTQGWRISFLICPCEEKVRKRWRVKAASPDGWALKDMWGRDGACDGACDAHACPCALPGNSLLDGFVVLGLVRWDRSLTEPGAQHFS